MVNIEVWMDDFITALDEIFGERVYFVGLQGSYARGEATETSDIDTVVILDEFSADDIKKYNAMLDSLPNRELICGFISGKEEILNWEPSDLFQFYHDTKSIKGSLDELLTKIDTESVRRAIKIQVCNIYHGCVHNMLHEKDAGILKGLYKSASFAVQAICFMKTGKYITRQKDLFEFVSPDEQEITQIFINLKKGGPVDFEMMSIKLFDWSKKWINKLK
ncbi:MAG: nucleotidyltransferase domain-containing protein [Oscillospiraceae bacterium]|nr:nucleotidyltransferase domain-containing protein [Oscillospiraceae bacterium]